MSAGDKHVQLAVFTVSDDLHALAIQKELESRRDCMFHIVETDRFAIRPGLTWSNVDCAGLSHSIPTRDGRLIDPRDLDLVWWRRSHFPQVMPDGVTDPIHVDLVNRDCSATLLGLLLNEFEGVWINDPSRTRLAENKLFQLRAASLAGFRTPRTLVSQDPEAVRRFCRMLDHNVIVKSVRGAFQRPLYTTRLTKEHLADDGSIRLAPTMYQECIEGTRHLRVQCFGEQIHPVLIESDHLDWRKNLDVPFRIFELDAQWSDNIRTVLRLLGLKMGIVDLKLDDETPVWFEINPQGQFLFVEPLSALPVTSLFADFLLEEAAGVAS